MPGIKNTMNEFSAGTLRSGSKAGPVVRNRKQAVAIALSEARKKGQNVPPPPAKPDVTASVILNTTPVAPTSRGESVPGLMATRQALRGMRLDSIRHIKKPGR